MRNTDDLRSDMLEAIRLLEYCTGGSLNISALRARLEKATITEPGQATDFERDDELLAALGRDLGRAWGAEYECDEYGSAKLCDKDWLLYFSMDALRAPNGPAEVARALRVLAGQGRQEGAGE